MGAGEGGGVGGGGGDGPGGGAGIGAVGEETGAPRWNEERNGLRKAVS